MSNASRIVLVYGDAPGTPASGKVELYSKDDKYIYYKGDDGIERLVTASGTFVATTLLELLDTPNAYDDGKYLRSTASGTVWATVSGAGVSNHSDLSQLDYASAGHTGFASNTDLVTVSGITDTNASDIATNVVDIAQNAWDTSVVSGTADTNTSNISTNTSDIADNTTLIGTTSGTLQTQIDTNASDVADNTTLITTASGDIVSQIITDHSELSQLDYASAGHTGFAFAVDLTNVSGTVDTNTNDISTLDIKIDTTSGTLQTEINNMTTTHSGLTDMPSSTNTDHDGRYYTQTQLGSKSTGYTSGGDLIGYPSLAGASWNTVGKVLDLINSTGRTTGGFIVDEGNFKVTVSGGTGFIKAEDVDTSEIFSFDWTTTTGIEIPADSTRYIGVVYNGGTPIVDIRASNNYDLNTEFILGSVVNENGTLHIFCNPWWVTDGITNVIERFRGSGHITRDEHTGGLMLSVPGTRNIAVTAGTLWSLLNNFPIPALDTTVTGTFHTMWTDTGGSWTETFLTQYPVAQWNDLGEDTLQNLDNNKYANWWVYIEADDEHISLIYPQAQYASSASAEAETPPTNLPGHISEHGILIGRILFKEGIDAPTEVQSVFTTVFTASMAADHGNLAGLSDDDHSAVYFNTTRGDARYYTETELDAGQLDNRYYTESEVDSLNTTLSGNLSDQIASDIVTFSGIIDHNTILNTHNLTTSIDHDQLTNFDVNKHRLINDSATGVTDLWSAQKIDDELDAVTTISGVLDDHNHFDNLDGGTSGEYFHLTASEHTALVSGTECTIHKHDDQYYTETEVDTISGSLNDDINTNTGNIATNVVDITSNTASIAVVSGTADTNASDIITNANAIATNTTLIGTTSGTLQAGIDSNASAISDNTTLITTASGDIVSQIIIDHSGLNELDYASAGHTGFQPAGDYAINTDLATVSGLVDDNAADIATNTGDISTNAADILTNVNDIAANTTSIAVVSGTADTNAADILTNVGDIADNTTLIGTTSGTLQAGIDTKDNYSKWTYTIDGAGGEDIDSGEVLDFIGGDNITLIESGTREITISGTAGGGVGGLSWSVVSTDTTAEDGNGYMINASGGNILITTPDLPSEGDIFAVCDIYNMAQTNTITVSGSDNIEGVGEPLVVDINGAGFELVYADATRGWEIVNDISTTQSGLDTGQLDNRYYTETELDAGQLDNRYYTETEVDTISGSLNAKIATQVAGQYTLASGTNSATVPFATNEDDTSYIINITIQNTVDSPPSIYPYTISATTVSGFDALFAGTIDSANYKLNWILSR